jgi:glycosyltransferase involved in cell wall biosynthesis
LNFKKYAAKDNRITIVDKENGGYGICMNIGLDKAT